MKKCSKCKLEKEFEEFGKNKSLKDGLSHICKKCRIMNSKKYYTNNLDKIKKYRENNKIKSKNYNKSYNQNNKEKIKIQRKIFYEKNKERLNMIGAEWRNNNREKILNKNKDWKKNNQEKVKEYNKKYQKEYRNINRKKLSENCKIRRQTDHLYKLQGYIGNMINKILKSKNFKKTSKGEMILGCTYQEFKLYLESKFESWMNWDNYGNPKDGIFELNKSWDIDHIIPLASALNEDELIRLNHYTNLQPLCSYTNRFIKRDKLLD